MSNRVETELKDARARLLDLTLRNRLLNHRTTKRRTLRIVDEVPHEVYKTLVLDRKQMRFTPSQSTNGQSLLVAPGAAAGSQAWTAPVADGPVRQTDGALQTNIDRDALFRKLFTIHSDSEAALDEQGYRVLFLALGFLQWYEPATGGGRRTESEERQLDSERPRLAPLLLVPVALQRSGARKSFRVGWSEEDLAGNISLAAKLLEFGVTLPEFPETPSQEELIEYFDTVSRAVEDREGWRVTQDVVLDVFSFHKFVMYKDLDPKGWPEESAPKMNALLRAAIDPAGETVAADGGFDSESIDSVLKASSLYHVVDADPSQVAVLEEAKQGRNLVVEGPPGTGKSQTITNLIAELLAAEKSVLFVSEKMAALEVVKDRLDAVGLAPFCLEVHSRKSNKKAFLKQLEKAWHKRYVAPANVEADFAELEVRRDELNQYAAALREPLGAIHRSPAQLFADREKALSHFGRDESAVKSVVLSSVADQTPETIRQSRSGLEKLVAALRAVTPVTANPWRDSRARGLLPQSVNRLEQSLRDTLVVLERMSTSISSLGNTTDVRKALSLSEIQGMLAASRIINSLPEVDGVPEVDRDMVKHALADEDDKRSALRSSFIGELTEYGKLCDRVFPELKSEAIDCDAGALEDKFQPYAQSLWRWFQPDYWRLRRDICALYQVGKPFSDIVALEHLGILRRAIRIRASVRGSTDDGRKAFGPIWKDERSDVEGLKRVNEWLAGYVCGVRDECFGAQSIERIFDREVREAIPAQITKVEVSERELELAWTSIKDVLELDDGVLPNGSLSTCPFTDLEATLGKWIAALPSLPAWGTFLHLRDEVEGTLAGPLVPLINGDSIDADRILPTFDYQVAESALAAAFEARSALAAFSSDVHRDCIDKFAELDRALIKKNRLRLAVKLMSLRPTLNPGASIDSEAGILQHQFNRKRGHMAIRKLMSRCSHFIRRTKPCFMMSPISVAQFLDPTCEPFDVVIFDEASQVRTEEAYGAFLRAKQAIVIGDTQQLPPTNFFDRMISDEGSDGDGTGVADMESILHLCRSKFQTARLTWHYRSQHETLIAGSNQQFYNNSLRIYPSATDMAPGLGLEWRHLRKNLYDRGRSAINRGEAEAVADAVMRHYRTTPELSLGVGTLSSKQQDAIQQEIDLKLRNQPADLENLEKYFNRDRHEHCFVKNLETIQGDERDVIYVSVGYGHTDAVGGRVNQNFGPVTNSGGERRLNVLFTRARRHCLIFSNFGSDDLVVTQKSSRGVQVLQAFLKYAETRILPADTHEGVDADSPFEESVAEVLRNKGHDVAHQVGCAGYFIDLAVRNPDAPGRYVIGIECDGAQYHSSRVARDRDRLREEILIERKWSIHRVWSTDWYRSRRAAEERLLAAVDDALLHRDREPPARSEVPDDPFEGHIIEDSAPASGESEGEAYQVCESLGRDAVGELHAQPTAAMREMIERVVHVESPICEELVISRIRKLWGLGRAGRLIREKIKKGIAAATRKGTIQRRGEFLWRADQTVPPVRRCGTARPTNLDFVCDEEITEAIKAVLEDEGTMPAGALVGRVTRRLGIQSTSKNAATRIRSLIMALRGAGEERILD